MSGDNSNRRDDDRALPAGAPRGHGPRGMSDETNPMQSLGDALWESRMAMAGVGTAVVMPADASRFEHFFTPGPANITRLRDLAPKDGERFAHLIKSDLNPSGADPDALLPQPTGWHVLVMQYIRPEGTRTRGGIILAAQTLKEDEYQGRVGLVLALGPDAYADRTRYLNGQWVRPGEWIMWPKLSEHVARISFGPVTLAVLPDERVLLTGVDPDVALGR